MSGRASSLAGWRRKPSSHRKKRMLVFQLDGERAPDDGRNRWGPLPSHLPTAGYRIERTAARRASPNGSKWLAIHTTHELSSNRRLIGGPSVPRGRCADLGGPSTLSRKPGLQPAWETLIRGVLTEHPSRGLRRGLSLTWTAPSPQGYAPAARRCYRIVQHAWPGPRSCS